MAMRTTALLVVFLVLCTALMGAQNISSAATSAAHGVPRLIKFSGTVSNTQGTVALTFALYKDATGGAPLWLETQNVTVDEKGRFTTYLGANHAQGVPADLFAAGEARWLGVQPEGQTEQPRVLLVSVPYALKAADADALGGHRLSEFVLAGAKDVALSSTDYVNATAINQAAYAITGADTNALTKFTSTAGDMTSSAIYELNGNLGIGTSSPGRALHIKSAAPTIRIEDTHFASSFWELQQSAYVDDWFGFLRYDTSQGSFGAVPARSMIISNDGRFGLGVTSVYNNMSAKVNIGAGSLRLWGAAGTDGIIYPDGSKQTTAFLGPNSIVASIAANPGSGLTTNTSTGAVTLTADTAVLQKRVGTSCAAGSAINSIGSDGSVSCQTVSGGGGSLTPPISLSGSGSPPNYVFAATETASGPIPPDKQPLTVSFMQSIPSAIVGYGNAGSGVGAGVVGWGQGSGQFSVGVIAVATGTAPALVAYNSNTSSGGAISAENDGTGDAAIKAKTTSSSGTALGLSAPYGSSSTLIDGQGSGFRVDGTGAVQAQSLTVGNINFPGCNNPPCQISMNSGVNVNGDLHVFGQMTALNKAFRIDHPLDPGNKYLYHASIESSEMMNLYTGTVSLDKHGEAWVQMPDWFEALNGEFRYQLTAIGAPGPKLYIAQKISGNRFKIGGGKRGMEVSWLVTGVRHDAYEQAHPMQVEVEKTGSERGSYANPELYKKTAAGK